MNVRIYLQSIYKVYKYKTKYRLYILGSGKVQFIMRQHSEVLKQSRVFLCDIQHFRIKNKGVCLKTSDYLTNDVISQVLPSAGEVVADNEH